MQLGGGVWTVGSLQTQVPDCSTVYYLDSYPEVCFLPL